MARRNRIPPHLRRALYHMAVFQGTRAIAILPLLSPPFLNRVVDRWADRIRAHRTARRRPGPSAEDWKC